VTPDSDLHALAAALADAMSALAAETEARWPIAANSLRRTASSVRSHLRREQGEGPWPSRNIVDARDALEVPA
jgi:hypothetical protein